MKPAAKRLAKVEAERLKTLDEHGRRREPITRIVNYIVYPAIRRPRDSD
jgi:hypothetical protein